MKNIISIFLLLKSLLQREFTSLDIQIAYALMLYMNSSLLSHEPAPDWLVMIANLTGPAILPEVWADYVYEWKTDLFPGNDHQDRCGGE